MLGLIVQMASRKNRSRKANRKSPQLPPGLGERLRWRFEGLFAWLHARRWIAFVGIGLLLDPLFARDETVKRWP